MPPRRAPPPGARDAAAHAAAKQACAAGSYSRSLSKQTFKHATPMMTLEINKRPSWPARQQRRTEMRRRRAGERLPHAAQQRIRACVVSAKTSLEWHRHYLGASTAAHSKASWLIASLPARCS